jgi:hypothetical protein
VIAHALNRVRTVREETNLAVLTTWPFGEALGQLGDDETLRLLRDHLAAEDLPRHVRFWIQRLIKATEKGWQKRAKDLSPSWSPWTGEIRTGRGWLHLSGGDAVEVFYAVWAKPAGSPGKYHSWGGTLRLEESRGYDLLGSQNFELEIEAGARGTVLVTRVNERDVVVVGSGVFPQIANN